jgi:hypothetical protein
VPPVCGTHLEGQAGYGNKQQYIRTAAYKIGAILLHEQFGKGIARNWQR